MPHPAHCRYCAAPLPRLLSLQGDVCAAAACRLRAGRDRLAAQREQALDNRRAAAVGRGADQRVATAPVIWLNDNTSQMTPALPERHAEHAAHLAALVAAAAAAPPAPPTPEVGAETCGSGGVPTGEPSPVDAAVCAFCRGGCCHDGGVYHAFIDQPMLSRWQERHGGTIAEAASYYLQRLPDSHVSGSCLYSSQTGCVLPRDERSPVCNSFACASLHEARGRSESEADRGLLLVTSKQGRVISAAWLAELRQPSQAMPISEDGCAHPPESD